jgi:hypothetical protein
LVGAVSSENKAIESMLDQVQEALDDLPSPAEPYLWTRSANRRTAV